MINRKQKNFKNKGFTLIELMVVVVVISILVGLLIPAILKAKESAREKKARTEIYELQKAWSMYYQTFEKLPGYSEMSPAATAELGGNNPRKITFMEFTPDELSNGFQDPWKETYKLDLKAGAAVKTEWKFQTRVQCKNVARGRY